MNTRVIRIVLTAAACMVLGASIASAQTNRTWVSGVGDDAYPCSRTAPCKTFAGAISKTLPGGMINCIDQGSYGPVTISKALTINCVAAFAGVLAPNGSNGISVSAAATDIVILRNLQIDGVGTGNIGVRVNTARAVILDNVNISGFDQALEANAGNTTVIGGVFSNNRGFAVQTKNASSITLEHTELLNNTVAVQATGAGSNVRMTDMGVYNNLTGFGCGAGTLASTGNNRKANNVGGVVAVCTPTVVITIQ